MMKTTSGWTDEEEDGEDKCSVCGRLLKWMGESKVYRVCKSCYTEVVM